MENIMKTIRKWESEAFSSHNDGWTQNGYRKKLIDLREYLNDIDKLNIHGDEDA